MNLCNAVALMSEGYNVRTNEKEGKKNEERTAKTHERTDRIVLELV